MVLSSVSSMSVSLLRSFSVAINIRLKPWLKRLPTDDDFDLRIMPSDELHPAQTYSIAKRAQRIFFRCLQCRNRDGYERHRREYQWRNNKGHRIPGGYTIKKAGY